MTAMAFGDVSAQSRPPVVMRQFRYIFIREPLAAAARTRAHLSRETDIR